MKNVHPNRKFAFIWFSTGIVSAPSIFWIFWQARFQNHLPPRDENMIGAVLGIILLAYFAVYFLRRVSVFGDQDFKWVDDRNKIYHHYSSIVILELITVFTWHIDDFSSATIGYLPILQMGNFEFNTREAIYIAVLLLTIPLTLRLIQHYLDFLRCWISSGLHFFSRAGLYRQDEVDIGMELPRETEVNLFEPVASHTGSLNHKYQGVPKGGLKIQPS